VVGDDDVLLRVRAAGCGPDVWQLMTGLPFFVRLMPGFRKFKTGVRGRDVAGTMEAVGPNVTRRSNAACCVPDRFGDRSPFRGGAVPAWVRHPLRLGAVARQYGRGAGQPQNCVADVRVHGPRRRIRGRHRPRLAHALVDDGGVSSDDRRDPVERLSPVPRVGAGRRPSRAGPILPMRVPWRDGCSPLPRCSRAGPGAILGGGGFRWHPRWHLRSVCDAYIWAGELPT
jgi:hypothetical protein